MEAAFVIGPEIATGIDHDPTFFSHTCNSDELIGQVAATNPAKIVLYAHGSRNGEMHFFNEEGDENAHPVEIAQRVMATVASRTRRRPNLRVVEAYGCSIGTGVSTKAAAAASDDPTSSAALYKSFCRDNPDVLCIINAGSHMIFGSDLDIEKSLTEPNIFKLIVSKILNRAETFKVLSGKSGELESFRFRVPQPKGPKDLSDAKIKDFLTFSMADFTDFYRDNIGPLTPEELKFSNNIIDEILEKTPQELSAIRRQYAMIEAQRGNVKYLRHYLNAGVKADHELLRAATVFGSMETVRFLHEEKGLGIDPILTSEKSPLELAAKNCNFSTTSYLCEKKVKLKDSLSEALKSRLAQGTNFLKTVAVLVASGAELKNKDREAFERDQAGDPRLLPVMLIASEIAKLPPAEKSQQLSQFLMMMDDRDFFRSLPRIPDDLTEPPIKWSLSRFSKPKFSTEASNFGEILHDSFKAFYLETEARAKRELEAEADNAVIKLLADEAFAARHPSAPTEAERKHRHEIRGATATAIANPDAARYADYRFK